MGKWEEVELKKIIGFKNGFAFKSKLFKVFGLPIVRISNLQDGLISEKNIVYFNPEDYGKDFSSYEIKKGDLLIAMSGATTGKISINQNDKIYYLNQRVGKFIIANETLKKYITFFLETKIEEHLSKAVGAAIPNLSSGDIMSLKIPFPPLPEQERIVAKLDGLFEKIDQAIGLLEENIANTEALMGSVLDEEFRKVKEKGWPLLKFTDFASLRHGHQFRKYDFVDSGIPVVKIGQCKKDGSLDLSKCNYIESSRLTEFKEDRIYKGDLLMALTGGTLGKVTWVSQNYGDLVQNYRVGNFFHIEGKSIKRFLMYILMSSIFQDLVASKVNQGAQPNIGKQNIDNMIVPVPSINEQEKLVEKFDVVMKNQSKIIETQTQKLNHLKALKSSLLDQAFKGEL